MAPSYPQLYTASSDTANLVAANSDCKLQIAHCDLQTATANCHCNCNCSHCWPTIGLPHSMSSMQTLVLNSQHCLLCMPQCQVQNSPNHYQRIKVLSESLHSMSETRRHNQDSSESFIEKVLPQCCYRRSDRAGPGRLDLDHVIVTTPNRVRPRSRARRRRRGSSIGQQAALDVGYGRTLAFGMRTFASLDICSWILLVQSAHTCWCELYPQSAAV